MSGRVLTVEAGVSRTLPASVLLGTDVPELMTILHEAQEGVAQAKELKTDKDVCGLWLSYAIAFHLISKIIVYILHL